MQRAGVYNSDMGVEASANARRPSKRTQRLGEGGTNLNDDEANRLSGHSRSCSHDAPRAQRFRAADGDDDAERDHEAAAP